MSVSLGLLFEYPETFLLLLTCCTAAPTISSDCQ